MKVRKKSTWLTISVLFAAMLLTFSLNSCYDDYGLTTSDYDLVRTFYDKDQNFTSYQTYAMPDSVYHIISEGEDDDISRQLDSYMLAQVVRNMENMGYTRIDNPDNEANKPDVVVYVAVTTSTHSGAIYQPGYGYPGWGWGYPGWGWGYPPYYGNVTYYSYSTGTMFIQMGDTNELDDNNKIVEAVWTANMNGLLQSSASGTQARVKEMVDRSFSQSPYLATN